MICSGHFCNSNQKTQNRSTKDNYIENAVEKIQTKKMIWWFYTNFSIQGQNLFPGQHLTTFELSSNQRLYLAQNWKAKIQWWCYWVTTSRHNKSKINLFMWLPPTSAFFNAFELGIMQREINDHHNNRSYKLFRMAPQQVHSWSF